MAGGPTGRFDGFDPALLSLREEVDAARDYSAAVLQDDADAASLREAADRLGHVLLAVAENDAVWSVLAVDRQQRPALTEQQRVRLEAAAFVDWDWLLERIDYRPEPPSDVCAAELALATARVLRGGEPATVDEARAQLHKVGAALREGAGIPDVPKRQRKRWLRRGLRIAAKASVVVGVAAGVAALALTGPAGLLVGVALNEGVVAGLDWAIDRNWPEEPEPEPPGAAEAALRALAWLDDTRFRDLLDSWSRVGDERARGMTCGDLVADPVLRTHDFVERLFASLYELWDAVVDAPWRDAVVHTLPLLRDLLQKARGELRRGLDADADPLLDLLGRIADVTFSVRVALVQLIQRGAS